jgi:hypothetical protein
MHSNVFISGASSKPPTTIMFMLLFGQGGRPVAGFTVNDTVLLPIKVGMLPKLPVTDGLPDQDGDVRPYVDLISKSSTTGCPSQGFGCMPCKKRSGLSGPRGISSKLIICALPKGNTANQRILPPHPPTLLATAASTSKVILPSFSTTSDSHVVDSQATPIADRASGCARSNVRRDHEFDLGIESNELEPPRAFSF